MVDTTLYIVLNSPRLCIAILRCIVYLFVVRGEDRGRRKEERREEGRRKERVRAEGRKEEGERRNGGK